MHTSQTPRISLVLLVILKLKQMLTSSGMQLNPPSTQHVLRQSATSHVSTRTGLMIMRWRFKTFLISRETPAFGKMTLFLCRSRKNTNRQSWNSKKDKKFTVLLISMICTTSSKQQRLSMSQRWIEHVKLLLNWETVVTEDTILSIPQHPERPSLDILQTPHEVQRAAVQMKNHAQIFKFGGENLASKLYEENPRSCS